MMKLLFWVLLTACALFFAAIRWGDALLTDRSAARPQQPLNAEKINLLAGPPEAAPVSTPPHALVLAMAQLAASSPVNGGPISNNSCMEWGEFSGGDLARASAALEELGLGNRITQRQVEYEIGYWVYMPPRQNRSEIDKKVSQLKSLGIDDFYVVQEHGKWHNAISLGIFKTEAAAQKYLEKLREKKVKSALVGERASKLAFTIFVLKNLNPEIAAKLEELKNGYQGSELKTVACE